VLSAALGGRAKGAVRAAAVDERLADELPILHAFLTAEVGDDGEPRNPSTLTVFVEDGLWKAVLHERQLNLNLFMTADGFHAVLAGLEARLASGRAEWRKDRSGRR